MKSTKGERVESDTRSASPEGETVQHTEVMPMTVPVGGTSSPTPEKARSVPSSATAGSVWLRYAPRQEGMGGCESSTET